VKVFMRTDGVHQRAVADTVFTAFALAALLRVFMYWRELRYRLAEREAARAEIEKAHTELALRRLVEVCLPVMREADLFARFGGEEFIVALMHTNAREAMMAAERLRLIIEREPFHYESARITATSSFDVAQFGPGEGILGDAIRRADRTLYLAKRGGRNRVAMAPEDWTDAKTST
jgi:PleD family two-component response regulator